MDEATEKEEQIRLENILTFTANEVNKVADFINEMFTKATFNNLQGRDIQRINNMFNEMSFHKKKLDSHIFELTKIMQSPNKEGAE